MSEATSIHTFLAVLHSRAQWGWARAHAGGSFTAVCATAEEAINRPKPPRPGASAGPIPVGTVSEREFPKPKAIPVLVIQSRIGASLVIDITPAELEAIGPCPNL